VASPVQETKKVVGHIAFEYGEYRMQQQAYGQKHSRIEFMRLFVTNSIRNGLAVILCRRYGHKFEDDSRACSESGIIHVDCVRCGQQHHHQLY